MITKGLAASPIQAAIVTALKADATLVALVGGRIYDAVPDSLTQAYVAIGEWTESANDTLEDGDAGIGSDCTLTIESLTDDAVDGAGYKKVQAIADRVKLALHNQALSAEGWSLVLCLHDNTVFLRDQDQQSRPKRRAISSFDVSVEAA